MLTIQQIIDRMNIDLREFDQCMKVNKLKLNGVKTKFMVLGHKIVDSVKQIKIGNAIIERTFVKNTFRMHHSELNFNANRDYVCEKLAKKINFFSRIASKLDKATRQL